MSWEFNNTLYPTRTLAIVGAASQYCTGGFMYSAEVAALFADDDRVADLAAEMIANDWLKCSQIEHVTVAEIIDAITERREWRAA